MSKHARSASSEDIPKQPSTKVAKKTDQKSSTKDVLRHPSTQRAKEIDANTPMSQLDEMLEKNKSDHKPHNVLHWFRSKDLRQEDNKGLHAASQKAKEGSGSLITMYLFSPKDMEWHGTSAARSDFILESLRILKDELEKKNIPLAIIVAEERREKSEKVIDFIKANDISHVYANIEYEVDELRRDIKFSRLVQAEKDLSFEALHDQTVIVPGALTTGAGGPMKVFTPYHKVWLAETKSDPGLLDTVPPPAGNDASATKTFTSLFSSKIPELPENKQFASTSDRDRIRKLWPAGNAAGMARLKDFLHNKSATYADDRSTPALDPSSRLSAYFSAGVVSVREVLAETKKFNKNKHFDAGSAGVASWVREIVFREFYRQIIVVIPHNAMNLPQNLKFDNVQWVDDEEGEKKWYEGKTGVPFIDAGMRQLNEEAYMHNRLRMNTSSYLRANLLIDYRKGERWFAEKLIDWDLSNNTQGWEPSYTVFNPVVQAEKCDPDGDYIRKWVPELKNVKGKAVFSPHDRLSKAEFEKLGYPRPHVDYTETAARAKATYKEGIAAANP